MSILEFTRTTVLAVTLAVPGVAAGQMTRFTGSFTPPSNQPNVGIQLKETNDSFKTLAAPVAATWTFDVMTDGQTITFNTLRVAFTGTVHPGSNPLVSLDLNFQATVTGTGARDINPISSHEWDVEPFQMSGTISGTYHSLTFSQAFSTDLPLPAGSDTFETRFGFGSWPNLLVVFKPSTSASITSDDFITLQPPTTILLEPFLELDLLTINHPHGVELTQAAATMPIGDFDSDNDTDGFDFLTWQRGFGGSGGRSLGDGNGDGVINGTDFDAWNSKFGVVPVGQPVPETQGSGTFALAIGALASMKRRCQSVSG